MDTGSEVSDHDFHMLTRPRLSSHVLPRLYDRAGVRFVVLFDTQKQAAQPVSARAWACIRGMDGTRDRAGLVAWLRGLGGSATEDEVAELLGELHEAGMVVEGVGSATTVDAEEEPVARGGARSLLALPSYTLVCDGRGSCCRFYPSIAFTPHDVAKARAHCPEVGGAGVDETRVFVPLLGSTSPMRAVCTTNGRCVYLEDDGACRIHARGGASAKPVGCSLFPARFVDDGESVRVVPHLECSCVFVSARTTAAGAPLVPEAWRTTADLPEEIVFDGVIDPVFVTPSQQRSLQEVRELAKDWQGSPDGADVIGRLIGLAASLGGGTPPPNEVVRKLFRSASEALRPRLEAAAVEPWRSPTDLAKITFDALVTALDLLDTVLRSPPANSDTDLLPVGYPTDEELYLRVQLFGLGFVAKSGTRSCRALLFDRAFRVLVARALGLVVELAELSDPAFIAPLALVEATMRGYGLSAYVREVEGAIEEGFDRAG
jgi:lysine-N-methylase